MLGWLMARPVTEDTRDGQVSYRRDSVTLELTPGALDGVPYPGQLFAGLTEACQIIGGVTDVQQALDQIERFAPSIRKYTDGYGLYGVRIHPQLIHVYHELVARPQSRRAVITPNTAPADLMLGLPYRDHPCTLSLSFALVGESLDMHVSMRSTDAWLGLPMDLIMFSVVQASLAHALRVLPGRFTLHTANLHLYDRNMDKVYEHLSRDADESPWNNVLPLGHVTKRGARAALRGDTGNVVTVTEALLAVAVEGVMVK
jgi:thymidylate synthase